MLRFQTIGYFIRVDGSGLYLGLAIASEAALYLVTAVEPFNLSSLVMGRFMKQLTGEIGPFQTKLSDLPNSITGDSEWPVKTNDGFVCVFDRNSISDIRCSLAGNIRITNLSHSAIIQCGIIGRFRALKVLRELGWDVLRHRRSELPKCQSVN